MEKFLKKHEEKIKLYMEITDKGKKISDEINEKIKIYNEKKLDLRKEVNNLINKFKILNEEIKKLKLVEIDKKCNNDVIKKQKEIFADIDTIQSRIKAVIDNIKKANEEMKKKQNDILPPETYDRLSKKLNELSTDLTKLKDTTKEYNDISEIIKEENNKIKELETFYNSINETNLKESIEKFKTFEDGNKKLADNINNFQKIFIPKVNNLNEYVKQNDICKKEILEIFDKFKEQNIKINESIDKLLLKMKELFDETNKLKLLEIINKNKNEVKPNWEKIQEKYTNIIKKINSYLDKKKGSSSANQNNSGKEKNEIKIESKKVDNAKLKEISDKLNKEMKPLEEKQKEIIATFDKLKKGKQECLNDINKICEDEDNALNEIKVAYKNDIKNINMQNIKENFEKYKKFNEKYQEIHEKIRKTSNQCATFVKSYNEFAHEEFNNRQKIFENANTFIENGIGIDENNEKIIKKAEEIIEDIKKFKINELNDLFKNNVNKKMKDLNEVQEVLAKLLNKK